MRDAWTVQPDRTAWRSTILIWLAAVAVSVLFLTLQIRGNLAFALELRFIQLASIVLVGVSVSVSTVMFQTITGNRILSPSIMGLDALYVFCQTGLVFALGGIGFASLSSDWKFAGEVLAMMALSLLLFLPMLRRGSEMMLMILTGVVLGLLFRSLTSLIARLIDPNDFAVAQGASFASFGAIDGRLLLLTSPIAAAACLIAWRRRHLLDVLALGQDAATGLGVNWQHAVTQFLLVVAALTACATALVGPLAFLGDRKSVV